MAVPVGNPILIIVATRGPVLFIGRDLPLLGWRGLLPVFFIPLDEGQSDRELLRQDGVMGDEHLERGEHLGEALESFK